MTKLLPTNDHAFVRLALLFLVNACFPISTALAHPEGFSGIHVTLDGNRIRAAITLHTRDLGAWFPPGKYPDYVADVTREMEKTVDEIVELQVDGQPQKIVAAKAFLLEVGLIEIDVDYQLPSGVADAELLIWSKHLIRMPRGHQQLLYVEDRRLVDDKQTAGVILLDDVLSAQRDAAAWILSPLATVDPAAISDRASEVSDSLDSDESPAESVAAAEGGLEDHGDSSRKPKATAASAHPTSRISFYLFGVEHIITGYDHLLFLAALLLVCTTFSEAAAIITCFTVAHSITLALAALDVVRLPSGIVEPLIALSIVYIAVENLRSQPPLWHRVAITSFFGLIHGLGFASALREIGLGTIPGGVIGPLLRFNLGVESGQLVVAAILLPLLFWAQKHERFATRLVPVGSCLIALIGGYWLVSRVASQIL